jgi:hypothetical protein
MAGELHRRLGELYAAMEAKSGESDDPAFVNRVLARAAQIPEADLLQRLGALLKDLQQRLRIPLGQDIIACIERLRRPANSDLLRLFIATVQDSGEAGPADDGDAVG